MKKLRNLLVVTTLLMVLGFVLPIGQEEAAPDEGVSISSNAPAADNFWL
jgi:hypothetical protein